MVHSSGRARSGFVALWIDDREVFGLGMCLHIALDVSVFHIYRAPRNILDLLVREFRLRV